MSARPAIFRELFYVTQFAGIFFQLKELFSTIKNNQAQEEAIKILQSVDIENNKISCTDGCALQALIAYVKRFLQLFHRVKENVKTDLTSHEIVNCFFFRNEINRYVEQINKIPPNVEFDAVCFGNLIYREEHKVLQLRVVDGGVWTGLIKVYQVLENTLSMNDRPSEGHYILLTLEHLLLVDGRFSVNTLLQSTTAPHLLMVLCETNQLLNVETKQIQKILFNNLRQKQSVKIIFPSQSEGDTVPFPQDITKENSVMDLLKEMNCQLGVI